jgi:hypothetical protein
MPVSSASRRKAASLRESSLSSGSASARAQDAIVLVDDDRAGGHEGAALVVGAGSALGVVAGRVVDRHQRHPVGGVLVDVVGEFPHDLVVPDAHGASSPLCWE